ncbi:Aste57867_11549 [Aphanomyces stellatus]|uniref:Aste57867_11549 protein n=1 Tax=Aphanomyces stellatus TaxID=120398 RepID=A0A485KV58_9STRA|nr:hypothetical protein As57867_011506 [Aphanomyces stellatus]VFT88409.1 Aste57867_11549 [Aphanomyces stellatus]
MLQRLVGASGNCRWASSTSRLRHAWLHPSRASLSSKEVLDLDIQGHQKQRATPSPFSILIVGDGNFSYSNAVATAFQDAKADVHIVATSLDTRDELDEMYPTAAAAIAALDAKDVRVVHGINARSLAGHKEALGHAASFDRIVFNFPHFAEDGNTRNKISKHRELLADFFVSCRAVLAPHGQIWLALCAGQGGTPAETTVVRSAGDTWQVVPCAAAGRFLLLDVHPFPYAALSRLGYHSVGYRLEERAFHSEDGLVHVFGHEAATQARFAQTWSRNVSMWLGPKFTQNAMEAAFREVLGPGVTIEFTQEDEYTCAKTARRSLMFRVDVESRVHNFTRQRLTDYIRIVGAKLEQDGVAVIR